jgi:hypothetical protein
VEAIDPEIVDDLHPLTRLADLTADAVAQSRPKAVGRAEPVDAVRVFDASVTAVIGRSSSSRAYASQAPQAFVIVEPKPPGKHIHGILEN